MTTNEYLDVNFSCVEWIAQGIYKDTVCKKNRLIAEQRQGELRWTDFGLAEGHWCCPWQQQCEIMWKAAGGGRKRGINGYLFSHAEWDLMAWYPQRSVKRLTEVTAWMREEKTSFMFQSQQPYIPMYLWLVILYICVCVCKCKCIFV